MDYDSLRHAADSWGLLYLFGIFVLAVLIAFRPGSRRRADEAARIPLKED